MDNLMERMAITAGEPTIPKSIETKQKEKVIQNKKETEFFKKTRFLIFRSMKIWEGLRPSTSKVYKGDLSLSGVNDNLPNPFPLVEGPFQPFGQNKRLNLSS